MRVLAAPANDNPHGDVFTIPDELLLRDPIVCDSGRDGRCACGRSWVGITSRRASTIAVVQDREITHDQYIAAVASNLADIHGWDPADADEEAHLLADIAGDHRPGTLVAIGMSPDKQTQTFPYLDSHDG